MLEMLEHHAFGSPGHRWDVGALLRHPKAPRFRKKEEKIHHVLKEKPEEKIHIDFFELLHTPECRLINKARVFNPNGRWC